MKTQLLEEDLSDRKHKLKFQAFMNLKYHENAENDYSSFIKFSAFVSMVLSSSAFITVSNIFPQLIEINEVKKDVIFACITLIVTLLNIFVFAFGTSYKIDHHRDLKRKWSEFYGSLKLLAETKQQLDKLERNFFELNKEEHPPNQRRLKKSYNQACEKMGLTPVKKRKFNFLR